MSGGVGGGGGGERCDDGDSNEGSSIGRGSGDGGLCGDGSGGGGGGGHMIRHAIRGNSVAAVEGGSGNTSATGYDDGIIGGSVSYRKAATDSGSRQSRAHGIRKLQKCLSTTISNYDGEGSTSGSFSASHAFHAQCSLDIRNLTATTPQASMTSQSILTSVRQYSSFGSTSSNNLSKKKKETSVLYLYAFSVWNRRKSICYVSLLHLRHPRIITT